MRDTCKCIRGRIDIITINNQRLGSVFDVTMFSLSFAKLVMMSSAPAKSAGDAR